MADHEKDAAEHEKNASEAGKQSDKQADIKESEKEHADIDRHEERVENS